MKFVNEIIDVPYSNRHVPSIAEALDHVRDEMVDRGIKKADWKVKTLFNNSILMVYHVFVQYVLDEDSD